MSIKHGFQLYASPKANFKEKIVEIIAPKFELKTISDTDIQLDNTYNVTMRLKKAITHFLYLVSISHLN